MKLNVEDVNCVKMIDRARVTGVTEHSIKDAVV